MKLKKPKFWDYNKPNFISHLLNPLAKIFEFKLKFSKKSKNKISGIKSICVGNIYVGGTGKTSIAIELKKILDKEKIKTCFIKKEYKDQIDEQKLLEKFGKTFINKSRLKALKNAIKENYDLAIFDDGLQDTSISYDLSFVCFNKKNLIGNGRLIPAGPLRENIKNIKNYNDIFFNGNDENVDSFIDILRNENMNLNIYESKYEIQNFDQINKEEDYIVFSGIGNHSTFIDTLKKNKIKIIKDIEYPDHYEYSQEDLNKIFEIAKNNNAKILTTEKDYLRLNQNHQDNINFIKIFLKIDKIDRLRERLKILYENN